MALKLPLLKNPKEMLLQGMLLQPDPPALLKHSELVTPQGMALNRPQQRRNTQARKSSWE